MEANNHRRERKGEQMMTVYTSVKQGTYFVSPPTNTREEGNYLTPTSLLLPLMLMLINADK